jgi:uncharacterized protein (DUF58 family)
MAAALIAGMYSGLRVYYIVFFTQLFIVIAVLSINFWTVYTFKFEQEPSRKSCVKGEEVILHLEIVNEKPFPLSLIDVHVDVVSCSENVQLVFSLAPYSGKTFDIPISTPYRGRYSIGMTKLKITDIFGLISFPFDMRRLFFYQMRELVVLPKAQAPGTVSADITDTKLFSDDYLRQAEQGDSISGARVYHSGDALKRVHWKKSAQQGELFVKQYEHPEKERVIILVDTSVHGLKGEDALVYADTICECAASIALHSLSHNRFVRVINSADYLKPVECASLSGFEGLRRHLAVLPFATESPKSREAAAVDDNADLFGTLKKTNRSFEHAYVLYVLTRCADTASMQALELILSESQSVTLVAVGGAKPGGRVHSLYIETGRDVAQSLQSLF